MSGFKRLSDISKQGNSVKGESSSSKSKYLTVSAKKASDEVAKMGIHSVVSISDESAMTEEIECMAADFTQIAKGDIKTVITPISIRLKKEEQTKKLTLSSLKNVADKLMSLKPGGVEHPFVRFDRIQIFYCPLFAGGDEADKSKIDIELIDEGRSVGSEIIDKVEIPGGIMSMSELSMNFKVKRTEMGMIKLRFTADNIDVTGRAYGTMFIAFFVHFDHDPSLYQKKPSQTLLLDAMERPKDINSMTVFSQLGETTQKMVKEKRKSFAQRRRNQERQRSKLKKGIVLENDEDDEYEKERLVEFEKEDERSDNSDWETVSNVTIHSVMNTVKATEMVELNPEVRTMILDTGAGNHFLYNPNIKGIEKMNNVLGFEEISYKEINKTKLTIGTKEVMLEKALHVSNPIKWDIISYDALVKQGLVDKMSMSGNLAFLLLESKVIWELEKNTEGMLCFIEV